MDIDVDTSITGPAPAAVHQTLNNEPDTLNLHDDGWLKFRRRETGYLYDERMMLHKEYRVDPADLDEDDEGHHPEQPNRIRRIHERLRRAGCLDMMTPIPVRPLDHPQALLVHTQDHWEKVAAIAHMTQDGIANSRAYYEQLSLYVHPDTPEAALLSAGGVVEAALAVARGQVRNAFANVRPPGHHAEPDEHMGFCFFNNVAIAAKVVQQETPLKRIMILDWDVHHGNGTQRAFYDDDSVLYVSLHRYEEGSFYPGGPFGSMESCGEAKGLGYSVNIPWPESGMTDADYIYAFMRIVMPIAYEFAPELVIISAGFDAAAGDNLGECHVSPAGYAHMTHMLASLAGGNLVVALEGGYNLESISRSALAVAEVLLGSPPPMMPEQVASEVVTETVWLVSRVQSRYWRCIDPKACEPKDTQNEDMFSIPEILKIHRAEFLATHLQMYAVPFADEDLQLAFSGQVLCSDSFYGKHTLVVFIHDYGSLVAELDGALHVDLDLEKSYLLDASLKLCNWIHDEGFALLDVNLYPRAVTKTGEQDELMRRTMIYLWDNYIELSDATSVILVASGISCQGLMQLMKARDVSTKVKAVVQIFGTVEPPRMAIQDDIRSWYRANSLVFVPSGFAMMNDREFIRSHGRVHTSGEKKVSLTLARSIPDIKEFVRTKLGISTAAVSRSDDSAGDVMS